MQTAVNDYTRPAGRRMMTADLRALYPREIEDQAVLRPLSRKRTATPYERARLAADALKARVHAVRRADRLGSRSGPAHCHRGRLEITSAAVPHRPQGQACSGAGDRRGLPLARFSPGDPGAPRRGRGHRPARLLQASAVGWCGLFGLVLAVLLAVEGAGFGDGALPDESPFRRREQPAIQVTDE